MHGPPLTIDEIAAMLAREIAELRRLGVNLDRAVRVVAERHAISLASVTQMLLRHRRVMERRHHRDPAAA